jgi:hypothetical protein
MLRQEWAQGHSATTIARLLNARFGNGRSRNSVIGRRHRLQLDSRAIPSRPVQIRKKMAPKPPPAPKPPVSPPVAPQTAKREEPKLPKAKRAPRKAEPMRRVEIIELARNECRWPVNDAQGNEAHLFCGRVVSDATASYCAEHQQRSANQTPEYMIRRSAVTARHTRS